MLPIANSLPVFVVYNKFILYVSTVCACRICIVARQRSHKGRYIYIWGDPHITSDMGLGGTV